MKVSRLQSRGQVLGSVLGTALPQYLAATSAGVSWLSLSHDTAWTP